MQLSGRAYGNCLGFPVKITQEGRECKRHRGIKMALILKAGFTFVFSYIAKNKLCV